MYFVSIDAGAQVAIILLACGPYVIIVNCLDRFCTLGRAPRTKETLPDFVSGFGLPDIHEILRVDGLSTDPRVLGLHNTCPYRNSVKGTNFVFRLATWLLVISLIVLQLSVNEW